MAKDELIDETKEKKENDIDKDWALYESGIKYNNALYGSDKNYYETIGPERCKALGYNKTDLEKEYSDLQFDKSKLQEEIYKIFLVNCKYSKSWIKETLSSIYSSLGYNKTPKANDLEQYFEIKLCKVLDKTTGKSDNGFKIIKLKEKQEDDICDKD